MPNESISQMSAASLPLAGTELVPLVQGGGNVQTPISTLATGLNISPATITATSAVITGALTSNTANITVSVTAGKVTSGDAAFLHETSVSLTNGAGTGAATLTNAPVVGNPTKWIAINDSGVTRFIPCW